MQSRNRDIERKKEPEGQISIDSTAQDVEHLRQLIKDQLQLSDRQIDNYLADKKRIYAPVSIFKNSLSTLEALSIYLRDYQKISLTRIGRLLNRNVKTIWAACSRAEKTKEKFDVDETSALIPVNIFSDRTHSLLENLVHFLHIEKGLRFSAIAKLLQLNPATIWTVNARYNKKDE